MPETVQMPPANDHDLLVVVHTNQNNMARDVREIKDDLAPRMRSVENTKLDRTELIAALAEIRKDFDTAVQGIGKSLGDAIKQLTDAGGDHETRIRRLERYLWIAIGGLAILQIGVAYFKP